MFERKNFGKLVEPIEPPNLIEIQTEPYVDFLQQTVDPDRRKLLGLQAVFKEVFPIESYDGQVKLDFVRYTISEPKLDALECQREGVTYSAALHMVFRLQRQSGGGLEESVYMGEIPLMTPQGTFVINGAERVFVSQLNR